MTQNYIDNKINYAKNVPIDNLDADSEESAERVYLAA